MTRLTELESDEQRPIVFTGRDVSVWIPINDMSGLGTMVTIRFSNDDQTWGSDDARYLEATDGTLVAYFQNSFLYPI